MVEGRSLTLILNLLQVVRFDGAGVENGEVLRFVFRGGRGVVVTANG